MVWQVNKIRFEQPISYDLVCSFDFSELEPKNRSIRRDCSSSEGRVE